MLRITLDARGARALVREVSERAQNTHPVMEDFAGHMENSVAENFVQGGRPTPWVKSGSEQTLHRSGRLAGSITSIAGNRFMQMGTSLRYARIHHMGGIIRPKKARALAIPLQDWIKVGPRRYTGLTYMPPQDGDRANKGILGREENGRFVPFFALRAFVKVPARPFLLFQEEDEIYVRESLERWLRTGEVG